MPSRERVIVFYGRTVKRLDVPVPPAVVTAKRAVTAPTGTFTSSDPAERTRYGAASVPSVTAVAPPRLDPDTMTSAPALPLVGERLEMRGATDRWPTENELLLRAVPPGVTTETRPVDAPRGTPATIRVDDMTENGAGLAPKSTCVAPVKLLPDIVTAVPGPPEVGVKPEMDGAGAVTVNVPTAAEPPCDVRMTIPVLAPAGTVALTLLSDCTANVALTPLNVTPVVHVRFDPAIATLCPTGPDAGDRLLTFGGGI